MDLLVGGIPTPLKNISQWEGLSDYPIYYGKMKNVQTTKQNISSTSTILQVSSQSQPVKTLNNRQFPFVTSSAIVAVTDFAGCPNLGSGLQGSHAVAQLASS